MPDTKLPKPDQVLGNPNSKLPSPQILNAPKPSSGTDYSAIIGQQQDKEKIESAIDFLAKDPTTKGGLIDVDKDVLRDVMSNPNVTQDQIKEAIGTMQSGNLYYLKNENGVMIPKQLKSGERPPKGYNVQSVWGTQKEANDDAWYTDLGKSLANGVFGVARGVSNLGQQIHQGLFNKESEFFGNVANTAEALQFQKDESLDAPLFNPEGVKEWSDLLQKERFDFSPKALWGTLNMAAESITEFIGGARIANGVAGLGPKAAAFTGSYLTQVGDNLENAKEAGLNPRDASKFALLTTSLQAAIDAQFGIESKIFQAMARRSSAELMRNLGRTIQRDATGAITEEGFRELAQGTALGYSQIAKSAIKEIGKGALREGAQETAQDVVSKGAQELWDKMSDDDKKAFGTDAKSPEAFASYIQNGLAGIVSGGALGALSNKAIKQRHQEQATEAFRIVEQGGEAETELRANLEVARSKGQLSQQEYDEAMVKLNAYKRYNEQSKDLPNISKEEKEEMFRLSFNIEALENEINISKEDLDKLDPVAKAKIEAKKELISGLQKRIKEIVLKNEVQSETEVGQQTVDRVAKDQEPKEEQTSLDELLKQVGKPKPTPAEKTDVGEETEEKTAEPKPAEKPVRQKLEEVTVEDWNDNNKTTSLQRKQILQEHLKNIPRNEIEATLQEGENGTTIAILPDGKKINLAQSADSITGKSVDNIIRENLPPTREEGKVVDKGGNTAVNEDGKPLFSYKEPVMIKRVEINAFDENDNPVMKDGKPVKKAVLSVYNKETGKHIVYTRERDKGKQKKWTASKYTPKEIEQLQSIRNANHLNDEIKPFERVSEAPEQKPKLTDKQRADLNKELEQLMMEDVDRNYTERQRLYQQGIPQEEVWNMMEETFRKTKAGKRATEIERLLGEETLGRELSEEEVAQELEKEAARELVFEETGRFHKKSLKDQQLDDDKFKNMYNDLDKLKGFPSRSVLGYISNYVTDPGIIKFINVMIENGNRIDEFSRFKGFEKMLTDKDGIKSAGTYNEGNGDIYLNEDFNERPSLDMAYTLVHEYLHAYTVSALSNPTTKQEKDFYESINKAYKELKNISGLQNEYGFTDLYEFVSELGSDPEFVNNLRNKHYSIFELIINAIKRLFGIKTDSDKLIDEAITSILDFIPKSNPELIDSGIYRMKRNLTDEEKILSRKIDAIAAEDDLSKYKYEELVDLYNEVLNSELPNRIKSKGLNEVMVRIAMNIHDRQVKQNIKDNPQYSPDEAVRRDIQYKDVLLKVLSHFGDSFPTLQFLSKLWDSAYFDMETQAVEQKNINKKLADAVIKDRNKRIGLVERGKDFLQSLFSNVNHKYFDFLDNGKGQLITLNEAKAKGLSEAQKEYLKFVRELIFKRKNLIGNPDIYNMDMEVLRLDKEFAETFRTEGITQAFSNLLGSTQTLENVRIQFKNPLTGKYEVTEFGKIQKALNEYGKKGPAEKAKALSLMLKYNLAARRQLKTGRNVDQDEKTNTNILNVPKGGEYTLDENGQLQSKFSRKRDVNRPYSQDFYRAVQEYINDSAHIEHISPLVPIVNSIAYINKNGVIRDGKLFYADKKNVTEWLDDWTKLHVLKKPDEKIPELDMALRTLRFITSASTMMFNLPANVMNLGIGVYNNWRQENLKSVAKGFARMVQNPKYAAALIKKYKAVSTDFDSNPMQTGFGVFADLGFLGQKWGEFIIQGSGVLGLMDDKDYESFEFKKDSHGVEQLVVKPGVDEKALKEKVLELRNRVTDVQGKYSEKDRRNIMNNELGKAVMQFRQWVPDWWRMRFGENGSYPAMYKELFKDGFSGLKEGIRKKGVIQTFWENKAFMSNLKGALFTAFLFTLIYRNDDDEKKSQASKMLERGLSDVLFVFDPENLKFTLSRPISAIGTIEKFINAYEHAVSLETFETDNKLGDKGDLKIQGDLIELSPFNKIIKASSELEDGD